MPKIILVEDNPALIDIYRQVFSRTNFDVELATSAAEIRKEMECMMSGLSQKPDLIIMDLMLPEAHGLDILKLAKRDPELKSIPIFVLSNYENPDMEKDLHREKIWPERYLIKAHYTPAELLATIRHYLGEKPRINTRTA